ncbi:dihydroorotase [Caenispirillum salinarum]|uniref:dihydroorotase n=1 Tax=Caenispirillum salinarum TaxID=859058 RepID=UPI00384EAD7B
MPQKATGRVAYVNARLLDPATNTDTIGGVLTVRETIAAMGPDVVRGAVPADARIVDCQGACLAPGLVDMRVSLGEPGEDHKESLRSAGEAAVAGGVTSMVCLPNTSPPIDSEATVEFVARRARLIGLAKVYPYGAATQGCEGKVISEMGLLSNAGAVAFTDGILPIADPQVMRRALAYGATFGLLVCQHAEERALSGGVMNGGDHATRLGLSGIPREAEVIMLERDMRLVKMTGGRYHAAHLTCAESLDVIRRAKDAGLDVTCDTAPFYFALNEMAVSDYRTFAKLNPPLRGEDDRRAVIQALKDGVIDCIASDHLPQDQDTKRLPFNQASFGAIGLETLLPISLELYHNGHLSLLQVLRALTVAPARRLGLPGGTLAPGAPADFFLFDPDRAWKVTAERLKSKSKNTPFDGRPVQGRVLATVIDGRTVFEHHG